MSLNNTNIVIFDDQCNKCSRWAEFIRRRDPRSIVKLVGQNSDAGQELMSQIPKGFEDHDSVFLISEGGDWHSKSAAIWRICSKLSFPWPIASAMFLVPYPIRDYFYDIYAQMRK